MNTNTIKPLAIDGDIIAFRAASSVQKDICWGGGLYTCHAYLKDAIEQFNIIIDTILERINEQCDTHYDKGSMLFFFSDSEGNFRKYYNPDYKSNRKNSRKPTCYRGLVDYIRANFFTADVIPHLEADDQIGIYVTNPANKSPMIVSMDKDFKTIPCAYYDFNKDEIYPSTKVSAEYYTAFQTLIGDATDGYKGCPTFGKVKAAKYLQENLEDIWGAVLKAYEEQGLTKDDMILQATMAHILTFDDLERFNLGEIPPMFIPMFIPN